MKKFLAITLLICTSARAVDWGKVTLVGGTVAAGEILYHMNSAADKEMVKRSGDCCDSKAHVGDTFRDMATIMGGAAALNVLEQKPLSVENIVESGVISWGSWKLSNNESFKKALGMIPGVRGFFVSEHNKNDVQSIARSGMSLVICNAVWKFAKSTFVNLASDPSTTAKAVAGK